MRYMKMIDPMNTVENKISEKEIGSGNTVKKTSHKKMLFLATAAAVLMISGCARTTLLSPCTNYGHFCSKTPINSWDHQQQ